MHPRMKCPRLRACGARRSGQALGFFHERVDILRSGSSTGQAGSLRYACLVSIVFIVCHYNLVCIIEATRYEDPTGTYDGEFMDNQGCAASPPYL